MPRVARIVIPGTAHHITQRGNYQQAVFEESIDYKNYCRWINEHSGQNGLKILAYCLMTNHVHFIAIPEEKESLSKTFRIAHTQYACYMNKKRKTNGHLWQGRFYSRPMNARHLYRAIRYVEQNPVRSKIVKRSWNYQWSSAKWHVGLVETPNIDLVDTDLIGRPEWKEYLCEADEDFTTILQVTDT